MSSSTVKDRSAPRMAPLALEDLEQTDRSIIEPLYESADTRNILMTLANHPDLLREWLPITRYTFNGSKLKSPDIELICLRTTWSYKADYEYTHHAKLAEGRGLSIAEIDQVPLGPNGSIFSNRQKALLRAVDKLLDNRDLPESEWQELSHHYSDAQVMDIVITCANYAAISLMQKSLRVQLEEGFQKHPHFHRS